MTQEFQVKVSMNQAAVVKSGLVLKQGDFGMQLKIEVLNFDTSNTTPQIVFRKPMGAVESTSVTKSGNVYTYTFKGTELDTPGKVFCDLKLKNSTTQRISTASFQFECIADTLDGLAEESSSYSDTVEQVIDSAIAPLETAMTGLDKEIASVNENFDDAKVSVSSINPDSKKYMFAPDYTERVKDKKITYASGVIRAAAQTGTVYYSIPLSAIDIGINIKFSNLASLGAIVDSKIVAFGNGSKISDDPVGYDYLSANNITNGYHDIVEYDANTGEAYIIKSKVLEWKSSTTCLYINTLPTDTIYNVFYKDAESTNEKINKIETSFKNQFKKTTPDDNLFEDFDPIQMSLLQNDKRFIISNGKVGVVSGTGIQVMAFPLSEIDEYFYIKYSDIDALNTSVSNFLISFASDYILSPAPTSYDYLTANNVKANYKEVVNYNSDTKTAVLFKSKILELYSSAAYIFVNLYMTGDKIGKAYYFDNKSINDKLDEISTDLKAQYNLIGNEVGAYYPVNITAGTEITASAKGGVNVDAEVKILLYNHDKTQIDFFRLTAGTSSRTYTTIPQYGDISYLGIDTVPSVPVQVEIGSTVHDFEYYKVDDKTFTEVIQETEEKIDGVNAKLKAQYNLMGNEVGVYYPAKITAGTDLTASTMGGVDLADEVKILLFNSNKEQIDFFRLTAGTSSRTYTTIPQYGDISYLGIDTVPSVPVQVEIGDTIHDFEYYELNDKTFSGAIEDLQKTAAATAPAFVVNSGRETYKRLMTWAGDDPICMIAQVTDVHAAPYAADKYKVVGYLNALDDLYGFDIIGNFGDIGLDTSQETEDNAWELLYNTKEKMSADSPWVFCKGNHDDGRVVQFSDERLSTYFEAPYAKRNTKRFESGNCYGYVDLEYLKIRAIYVNTSDSVLNGYGMTATQLTWLADLMAQTQSGWDIVILSHMCVDDCGRWNSYPDDASGAYFDTFRSIMAAFVAKTAGSNITSGVEWDFTNVPSGCKLICNFAGDSHFNNQAKTNGVQYIVRQGYGGISQSDIPTGGVFDIFSYHGQCLFDVLCIKKNGNAKVFRIGVGGSNRDFAFTY